MEKDFGLYFKKISERLERQANGKGEKREITFAQGRLLQYLHRHDGEDVTLRDLDRFLDCSHATVSGIVSRLVEKGFVVLEPSREDKRAKNVRLTEKERACFLKMRKKHAEMENKLAKGFSKEEREKFIEYLERVYNNLED